MPSQFYTEESRDKAMKVLQERNLDGTGPEGKGPKTGRGMGKCESEDMSETKGPLSRYQVKARTPEETPPKPTQKDLQILTGQGKGS